MHTVVNGDSLWRIASELRPDNPSACTNSLYRDNADVIGPDPDLIYPGQRLQIPEDC